MINLFTDDETKRIEQAILEAETRTSAEIVPCVIDVSGSYEVSVWRGCVLAAAIALALVMLVVRFYGGWGFAWLHTPWGVAVVVLLAGAAGAAAVHFSPALKRTLAGGRYLDERVHQRAMQAFVEEEVFRTKERTGILIFVSLFEHRIEVLGDAGINSRVEADDWAAIVMRLREGIKEGHLAEGLTEAVRMCGDLLERSGVAVHADAIDELSNRVRLVRYER